MSVGLSPDRISEIDIYISPKTAQTRAFGNCLLLGSTPNVIDISEGFRTYTDDTTVASDFGTTAPETLAAQLWFSQQPRPATLFIGFYAQSPTSAVLHGGLLPTSAQLLSNFNAITNGSFVITVDGVVKTLTGMNFAACTNLSMVAAVIQTAFAGSATCSWTGQRFNITSFSVGATSTIGYATPAGSGTNISSLLYLTANQTSAPVNGVVAESAVNAVLRYANMSSAWYALIMAPVTPTTDTDKLNIAAFIEGANPTRIYGFTTSNSAELVINNGSSLCWQLKQLGYARTFAIFSTQHKHAIAGMFANGLTVDFTASNTTITLKFKSIIGVAAETLTASQADALEANGLDVFVNYNNGTAIIEQGISVGGRWFDEVHGLDWLQNYCQTGQYNLFLLTRKIPQTDAGVTQQLAQLEHDLQQGVENGLIAPGVWNAGGFGQLQMGDTLIKGFYTYAPPVSTQSQGDRDARKPIALQAAIKLAGAFHSGLAIINVNR